MGRFEKLIRRLQERLEEADPAGAALTHVEISETRERLMILPLWPRRAVTANGRYRQDRKGTGRHPERLTTVIS